jgi:hypothetical protein
MKRYVVVGVPAVLLFGVALVVRLNQQHRALLYPDGYQYLLMARGFSEHLQPTTVLGPGGDTFAPIPDAALKPLFPLLVAGVHMSGMSWLDAARSVTALAGAASVVLLSLLVSRLSGSNLAGLGAGLLLLASPSAGFWSGFSGPDPLAQALVLAAALAFAHRSPRFGGALSGLAIAARPELVVVAIAAALVSLRREASRHALREAAPFAVVVAMLVFVLPRTPVALVDWRLLLLSPFLLAAIAFVALAPATLIRFATVVGLGGAVFALFAISGPHDLWREDWPLLVLGTGGVLVLVRDERRSEVATLTLGLVLLLGAVYLVKNPSLARYFSLLLPAAAVLAGIATTSVPERVRPLALAGIALAVLFGFLHPAPGSRNYDMFNMVASQIAPRLESAPLVTAAPDAYGFWLPKHGVRTMRPGASGSVLLDASQRLYAPRLSARGKVVARIREEIAFSRPNGDIDAGPAVLVAGRVVSDPPERERSSSKPKKPDS